MGTEGTNGRSPKPYNRFRDADIEGDDEQYDSRSVLREEAKSTASLEGRKSNQGLAVLSLGKPR